jgi:class 3 adenylate cyclase
MAKLSESERASLPDRAFAYIDSRGRRLLPINDEAHVRNALARFDQVRFESPAAKEAARRRLLNAAKRYGIVPVGFITGQIRHSQGAPDPSLPSGLVTLLFTDLEGSTQLVQQLGDRYADVLRRVRRLIRSTVIARSGRVVEVRADESFSVFEVPAAAVMAAADVQRGLAAKSWPEALVVRVRAGIHTGEITLEEGGYIGLAVHTAARVCAVAHGGQVVISDASRSAIGESLPAGFSLKSLGSHRLAGLADPVGLHQVEGEGLMTEFPRLRSSKSRR